MSAAALIYSKVYALGYTASPDLRNAAASATNAVIYEIKTEEMLSCLASSVKVWKSSIDLHILASDLVATLTAVEALTTGLHGATWTYLTQTAVVCIVTGNNSGFLEDSLPGATDKQRVSTLSLTLFHTYA